MLKESDLKLLGENVAGPAIMRILKNLFPEQELQKKLTEAVNKNVNLAGLLEKPENYRYLTLIEEVLRKPPRQIPFPVKWVFHITDENWKKGAKDALNYCSKPEWVSWFLSDYMRRKEPNLFLLVFYTKGAKEYLSAQIPMLINLLQNKLY